LLITLVIVLTILIFIILINKKIKEDKLILKQELLKYQKDKAQTSSKFKAQFLANMSHEIRTPMNGIIGMSYLLSKTDLTEKQKDLLSKIDFSAQNLLKIINDILDLSKIEAGKLQLHKDDFNLKEVMQNCIDLFEMAFEEKNLDFKFYYSADEYYYGDALRIDQIILNLLSNAVKFTEDGEIILSITQLENNKVKFIVKDSGIGLSQEQQNRLFSAFNQADSSTTKKYGGTGLGLAITKEFIKMMNGKIYVESKLGSGSAFIFEIELEKAKQDIITKNLEKKHDTKFDKKLISNNNILLVEDNNINQEIVLGILENSDIIIDIANNGQEACDIYNKNPDKYALILMDIRMPIMDGYKATKIIRAKDKNIPIIALSADVLRSDIEKFKAIGINEHLAKPIEIDKLNTILEKYL
jgi:CheY-like chemotaxis protein/nitrogen-specific signal transduction histidine kinase